MTPLLAKDDLRMAMIIEDSPCTFHSGLIEQVDHPGLVQAKVDRMNLLDRQYVETMERVIRLQKLQQQTAALQQDQLKQEIQKRDARILELESQLGI